MTNQELKEIEERALAATSPPWRYAQILDGIEARAITDGRGYFFARCDDIQNAEFIAHARTDMPDLIGEVKRLREVLRDIMMTGLTMPVELYNDEKAVSAFYERQLKSCIGRASRALK